MAISSLSRKPYLCLPFYLDEKESAMTLSYSPK